MKAQLLVDTARELLGTPWQHQGRVGGLALDCAGVPVYVGKKLGVSLEDFTNYGRLPVPIEMKAALDKNLIRVGKNEMQLGDVAWIRFDRAPQHLALIGNYLYGGFTLIHAYNGAGLNRVVEHRLDDMWLARIVGVWRYPGVES